MGICQSNPPVQYENSTRATANKKPNLKAEQQSDSSSTHNLADDNWHSSKARSAGKATEGRGADDRNDPQGNGGNSRKQDAYSNQNIEQPGYSSGGSSEPEGFGGSYGFAIDKTARESSDRKRLDRLHLTSMRNVLHDNSDLNQAVVRLETPFGKPIEEIYDGVHDGPCLGRGVSSVVRLVQHKASGVQYACKILDIGVMDTDNGLRQLREEILIMCQLDHPNIVRIEEVYESTNTIYLLQERCLGGDLFDRLDEQTDYHYTEAQCAKLVKQMVSAIRYLHSKGIIHRDLKLENFLFSSTSRDSELKLIDFGLSKHFDFFGEVQHERVGTPYTVAPEVIKGSYDEKCDIWAIGVITFLLLSGETPFGGCKENEDLRDVRKNILKGQFLFKPVDVWENVSMLSKKFVKRLLNVDPAKRPTARQVQRDEWLLTYAKKEGGMQGNRLSPRIVDALVSFKEYSEMRRLLHEVLSYTLLPEQIMELRKEFKKIDSDGNGEITLGDMKEVLMNTAGSGALGGLTEEEVEDIFNAIRVNKNESTIRWHEFVAAGLSQCRVDDRNLRLAFDRLDRERKGYIRFADLTNLLGSSPETVDSLKKMWNESMQQCKCEDDRISYEDFLALMKGQKRESHRRMVTDLRQKRGWDGRK